MLLGVFWEVKIQNTVSAKICLILNFERGGILTSQNSKYSEYPDLPKFEFLGGVGGGGGKLGTKSQNRVNWDF